MPYAVAVCSPWSAPVASGLLLSCRPGTAPATRPRHSSHSAGALRRLGHIGAPLRRLGRAPSNTGDMDLDEARAVLAQQHHAVLATTRADGTPQLSPVTVGVDEAGRAIISSRQTAAGAPRPACIPDRGHPLPAARPHRAVPLGVGNAARLGGRPGGPVGRAAPAARRSPNARGHRRLTAAALDVTALSLPTAPAGPSPRPDYDR